MEWKLSVIFLLLLLFFYFSVKQKCNSNNFKKYFIQSDSRNGVTRYSSEEISGNESNEVNGMTETERQADFNRHKEEMKRKRRRKKRTSSSMQSSTFQGKLSNVFCCLTITILIKI